MSDAIFIRGKLVKSSDHIDACVRAMSQRAFTQG